MFVLWPKGVKLELMKLLNCWRVTWISLPVYSEWLVTLSINSNIKRRICSRNYESHSSNLE